MSTTVMFRESPPFLCKLAKAKTGQLFYFKDDTRRSVGMRTSAGKYMFVGVGELLDVGPVSDSAVVLLKGTLTVEEQK